MLEYFRHKIDKRIIDNITKYYIHYQKMASHPAFSNSP